MGEAEGKGSISAHVTPSEPAAAFQETQFAAACPVLPDVSLGTAGPCLDTPTPPECSPPLAQQLLPSGLAQQTLSLACLPSLASCGPEGNLHLWNSSNSEQQLAFNPAIVYTDVMFTVHFRDSPQCCFRQPWAQSPFPKRQTSTAPMPVNRLAPTPNSACQIWCRSFHLLFFNFSICKTGVVTLASSVKSCS